MLLDEIYSDLKMAENRMEKALSVMYPGGSEIEFTLMCNQVNPSKGTVLSHHGDGTITVRLHRRGTVRNIHFESVI